MPKLVQQPRPETHAFVEQHGVVYEDESTNVLGQAVAAIRDELASIPDQRFEDLKAVKRHVIQAMGRFWRHEVGRRPLIMPVILED